MKIVHFLPSIRFAEGGVVRAVLDWCRMLSACGHRVTLMTHDTIDVPDGWHLPGLARPTVIKLPPVQRLGRLSASAVSLVREAVVASDVVHLHAPWIVANGRIATIAREFGKPYILSLHGMLDDWSMTQRHVKKRIFLALFARRLLDRAAVVHCTALAELNQARKWFSNARTIVLPYLIDLEPFMDPPGPALARATFPQAATPDPIILFLGRLHKKKGVDLLIDAAGMLRDQCTPFRLLIAGVGEADFEHQLRAQVDTLGLNGSVFFIGLVKGDVKLSLYQSAEVFVLPTSQENFGMVLIESLACATPVITTRGVDICEELLEAGADIVDRSPDAIARAIRRAIDRRQNGEMSGLKGKRWVFKNLSSERITAHYLVLYRRIIDSM